MGTNWGIIWNIDYMSFYLVKIMNQSKIHDVNFQYVDSIVNTIGRKRALLILLHLGTHKKLRYKDLSLKLGKISPSTFSSLLKQLCDERLIDKQIFGEIPPRLTEYSLTENGLNLLVAIDPLLKWVSNKKL